MTDVCLKLALLVALSSLSACASATPKPEPVVPIEIPSERARPYRLQVGDLVAVRFYHTPELNEEVVIRPDGMISLQLVADVAAAGSTPAELEQELRQRYASELARPVVSVLVKSFGDQRVFVGGEVARPGVLPLGGGLTLFQAVQQAGGFLKTANLGQVVLVRRDLEGRTSAWAVDVEGVESGESPQSDVALGPLDLVIVPRSSIAQLNLWVEQYIRNNIPVQNLGIGLGTPF
jgi:protein involved in polysaccharide export with SLBB domain